MTASATAGTASALELASCALPRISSLSIVIPTLNEADGIVGQLSALQGLRIRGVEVIVADGGSADSTPSLAAPLADAVVSAPRGRGAQMNAGASKASGDILLFLHADTRLPDGADELIRAGLATGVQRWGRFDVAIDGESSWFGVIGWFMSERSRLSGIATGDQGIFVRRDLFLASGGFPNIPVMEDIALSKQLKRAGRPLCLRERVVTSGRRWDDGGVIATIALMWRLRLAFFFGVDPAKLARKYGNERRAR